MRKMGFIQGPRTDLGPLDGSTAGVWASPYSAFPGAGGALALVRLQTEMLDFSYRLAREIPRILAASLLFPPACAIARSMATRSVS